MGRKKIKTEEELNAANTKYKNAWQKDNKERMSVLVNKGEKEKITNWARDKGYKSTNSYICNMIEFDMKYHEDIEGILEYLKENRGINERIQKEAGLNTSPIDILEAVLNNK